MSKYQIFTCNNCNNILTTSKNANFFLDRYEDEDIPNKVAVNEAIELAKIYCDESAPAFINGVLNKLLVSESSQGVETTPEG